MNTNSSELSDKELGEQLRDIQIPTDLKDKLRAIADQPSIQPAERPRAIVPVRTAIAIAVAASLIGVILIAGWQNRPHRPHASHPDKSRRTAVQPNAPVAPLTKPLVEGQLAADLENRQLQIDQVVRQLELARLQDRLESLKRKRHSPELDPIDELSLILALSDQAGVGFGGDFDLVRDDLKTTIEQYPGSRGAELAGNLISKHEFN